MLQEKHQSLPSVVFEKLSLQRGESSVLHQLSFSLTARRVGLLGDNGAGKSSLLRLLNGLSQPSCGRCLVCGTQQPKELARITGFLFQNPDHQIIFPTASEELAFGLRQQGASPLQAREKVAHFLARMGLSNWAERRTEELSAGQRQLLCLYALLITEPRLLALDEPFSSLDIPTRQYLHHLLQQLPQTLWIASHDLELLAMQEYLLWLDHGNLRMMGTVATVLPAYRRHIAQKQAHMKRRPPLC